MSKSLNEDPKQYVKYFFLGLAIISFVISLGYIMMNLMVISSDLVNFLIAGSVVFFLLPFLLINLYESKRVESKMEVIPRFFRDVVDNVESGADLISAFMNSVENEYGVLNGDVRKFSNQLSWGVNFDKAIMDFAKNVGDIGLQRDISLVVEARRVGGHAEKILRELSGKITTEILRTKERRSNLSSNTFTGYISFVIFLVIIVVVYNNLFVELSETFAEQEGGPGQEFESMLNTYLTLITLLGYEMAILSGFLFGLMQENKLISGAPHVVGLVVLAFIAFFFFI